MYVYQTIEEIKLTRNLLNNEYHSSEIDDECQAIDDEWTEFLNDFDDQKQQISQIEGDIEKYHVRINEMQQSLREQENAFQLMIANQSSLSLKCDKLEQIKVKPTYCHTRTSRDSFFQGFDSKSSHICRSETRIQTTRK